MNNNDSVIDATIRQSLTDPMQTAEEVKDHASSVRQLVDWTKIAILFDEQPSAILILLINEIENKEKVVSVSRFSLDPAKASEAVFNYSDQDQNVFLACCQNQTLTRNQIANLDELSKKWNQTIPALVGQEEIEAFFKRVEKDALIRGREVKITMPTRRQVWFDAHGRCMFNGCGVDLRLDPVNGTQGNFAYLAHNHAASETGPRGVLFLSELLGDEPDNILLLCDIHHRTIDTVAKADYPANRLLDMRRRYCADVNVLLDGLSKPKIPAFGLFWPVRQQVIAAPSPTQIAEALIPIEARLDGHLRRIADNDKLIRDTDPEAIWSLMPNAVNAAAAEILSQTHVQSYRAALFAMGPMPPLIALGAKLGNKNTITPMLFHRENGLWFWPKAKPQGDFYQIEGLERVPKSSEDVTVELALTALPESMERTSGQLGYPVVRILALDGKTGNGVLGHPHDGRRFRQHLQELFHLLRERYGVRRVHLLPCASNAACFFLGQAFDNYHPDIILYDFHSDGNKMIPRMKLKNVDNQCIVSTA